MLDNLEAIAVLIMLLILMKISLHYVEKCLKRHAARERMVKFVFGSDTTLVDMINFNVDVKSLSLEKFESRGSNDFSEERKLQDKGPILTRKENILLFGETEANLGQSGSRMKLISVANRAFD